MRAFVVCCSLALVFTLATVGCSPQATPTSVPQPTFTATSAPTPTQEPPPTPTKVPTLTAQPTPTPVATATSAPTPTPQSTSRFSSETTHALELVYHADLSKLPSSVNTADAMTRVRKTIEQRIAALGASGTVVQQGNDRILVQMSGVTDVDQAKKVIGQVGRLDFREQQPDGTWKVAAVVINGEAKDLTAAYFKPDAAVLLDPQTTKPEVRFDTTDEGSQIFEQVTRRDIGKRLGIFLDNQPILGVDGYPIAPVVQNVITNSGVITGLNLTDARNLVIFINSGVLPVLLTLISVNGVPPTPPTPLPTPTATPTDS